METLAEDERKAFDNLNKSFQQGEKGQQIEANADVFDQAVDDLTDIVDELTNTD